MYKEAYNLSLWYENFINSIKSDDDNFFENLKILIIANQALLRLSLLENYDSNSPESLLLRCKDIINNITTSYGTENSFKYYYGNEKIDIFGDNNVDIQVNNLKLDGYTEHFRQLWKSIVLE